MCVSKDQSPIVLAFSGGLDTSFCVPWLKETYGRDVVTATVDTGGIDATAAKQLEERAYALGASEHVLIDAKQDFFDSVIRYLIAGNVLRGNAYPHAERQPWHMAVRRPATTRCASR
jgi:argininosuccinate synthase